MTSLIVPKQAAFVELRRWVMRHILLIPCSQRQQLSAETQRDPAIEDEKCDERRTRVQAADSEQFHSKHGARQDH